MTLSDIEKANQLAHDILGRTLDELPPQTRRLLQLIHAMVSAQCKSQAIEQTHYHFSRRAIRDITHWGNTQLKTHLHRLEELEYLLVHRGGRGQSFVYELLYNGQGEQGETFLHGLIDIEKLSYDEKKSGANGEWSDPGRPKVGGKSGAGRRKKNGQKPRQQREAEETDAIPLKKAYRGKNNGASRRPAVLAVKSV